MNTKPLHEMTIDEIAALTPEDFERLAGEHNDRSELRENARNREIEQDNEADFSPILEPDEVAEILEGLLKPAPPPPFDPKHAREEVTPARQSILGFAKDAARSVMDHIAERLDSTKKEVPRQYSETDRQSALEREIEIEDRAIQRDLEESYRDQDHSDERDRWGLDRW